MVQRQTWTADLWVDPSGFSWYGNPQKIETCFQDITDVYFTCFDFFGSYYAVFVYVVSCGFRLLGVKVRCPAARKISCIWVHRRFATFANLQMLASENVYHQFEPWGEFGKIVMNHHIWDTIFSDTPMFLVWFIHIRWSKIAYAIAFIIAVQEIMMSNVQMLLYVGSAWNCPDFQKSQVVFFPGFCLEFIFDKGY